MRSPKPVVFIVVAIVMAAALLLASVLPAMSAEPGAEPPDPASTFIITEENDFFAGTDEHYTNGIKLAWVSGDLKRYAEDDRLPHFVLPYLAMLPFVNEPGQQYNVALALGQNMYTPQNTATTAYQPGDRPYAGWTYMSLALHAKTASQLDTFETTLGIVGPSARAGETQNNYHVLMGFKKDQRLEQPDP
jgi:Uncharacterized protein conserved in bacteria